MIDQNNSDSLAESVQIHDGCPEWAQSLIQHIYVVEVELGNVKKADEKDWSITNHEKLLKLAGQLDANHSSQDDLNLQVNALFDKIVRGLTNEKFTPGQIASFINSRIPTGTKLKYCSADEVLERI